MTDSSRGVQRMAHRLLLDGFGSWASGVFHNTWPLGLGAVMGEAALQATDARQQLAAQPDAFRKMLLMYIAAGVGTQLLIALLRSLFSERRDVMGAMRAMLRYQEKRERVSRFEEQIVRHELANRTHVAEMKLSMVMSGVPIDQLPHVRPIYDLDHERQVFDRMVEHDDEEAAEGLAKK